MIGSKSVCADCGVSPDYYDFIRERTRDFYVFRNNNYCEICAKHLKGVAKKIEYYSEEMVVSSRESEEVLARLEHPRKCSECGATGEILYDHEYSSLDPGLCEDASGVCQSCFMDEFAEAKSCCSCKEDAPLFVDGDGHWRCECCIRGDRDENKDNN